MTPELLPCPFCGSGDIDDKTDGWGKAFHKCRTCGAQGPHRHVTINNPWAFPKLWNTRAPLSPAVLAELPEVREMVENVVKWGFLSAAPGEWRVSDIKRVADAIAAAIREARNG